MSWLDFWLGHTSGRICEIVIVNGVVIADAWDNWHSWKLLLNQLRHVLENLENYFNSIVNSYSIFTNFEVVLNEIATD